MATSRANKVQSEIDKARAKLAEQQTRIKELEAKKTEFENIEIVDIVRGLHIPLDDLAVLLQSIRGGAAPAPVTSGQVGPKSKGPKIVSDMSSISDSDETGKEGETE
jgi:hypothetical protein